MSYEIRFLISLLATLAIELPVVFILVRFLFKFNFVKWHKIIIVGCIASTLTLPYLWFLFPRLLGVRNYLLIGEVSVTLVEAILYFYLFQIKISRAIAISFIANLVSFLIGRFVL